VCELAAGVEATAAAEVEVWFDVAVEEVEDEDEEDDVADDAPDDAVVATVEAVGDAETVVVVDACADVAR